MPIIALFALWRLADMAITLLAPRVVPYLGFFPYRDILNLYHLPAFLSRLAGFDGVHYVKIAEGGYSQYEQAFFPLYPLIVRFVSYLFPININGDAPRNTILAGLLISNLAFLAGLLLIRKIAKTGGEKFGNVYSVLFLLVFPTSFYFGTVYTEGLFFFLFIASLYFFQKKRYWLAGICAALSSATRLIGAFIIIPFAISLLWQKKIELSSLLKRTFAHLPLLISPLLGLLVYVAYLWRSTGDPLYFINSQPIFGAHRSVGLITLPQVYYRYFKIMVTSAFNFQYFTSLIEVVLFSFAAVVLLLDLIKHRSDKWRLGLNLFSWANLILPTLTGTFSSVPRYILFSISIFLFLGEIKGMRLKGALFIMLFLLHIVLLSFFIQGYFIS